MALPAIDTFTGANWAAPSASWTRSTAQWWIYGNAISTNSNVTMSMRWNADTFVRNQYAKATLTRLPNSNGFFIGPAVRVAQGSSGAAYVDAYAYIAINVSGSVVGRLVRIVNNTITQLGSNGTVALNDMLEIRVEGTTVTPYRNGAVADIGAQTDSTLTTAGAAGLVGSGNSLATNSGAMDNWEGNNLPVFTADFEGNNFSEWTATATDGGRLSVSAAAAMAGSNYGMSVLIQGSSTALKYAYYALPAALTNGVVRARIYLDPNSITMANGTDHNIFMIADGSSNPVTFIMLHRTAGGQYALYCTIQHDAGGHAQSGYAEISDAPHYVELICVRASNASSSDGYVRMWIDEPTPTDLNAVESITGRDNYDAFNDWLLVIAGANAGVDTTTSGTFYIDKIVVRGDGQAIGPVDGGDPEPVQVTVTDAGAGTDVLPGLIAALAVGEAGAGSDSMPGTAASLAVGESGVGADGSPSVSALLVLHDTAAGTDALSDLSMLLTMLEAGSGFDGLGGVTVSLSLGDVGSGADSLEELAAALALGETGAGTDSLAGITALLILADAGTGADTASRLDTLIAIAENGTGTDTTHLREVLLSLVEAGLGADEMTGLAAQLLVGDAGSGNDTQPGIEATLVLLESGSGAENIAGILASLTVGETGSGNDGQTINTRIIVSDTASGADALNLLAYLVKTIHETGIGAETLSARAALAVSDIGSGNDSPQVAALLTIVDAGSGADTLALIQAVFKAVLETATGTDTVGSIQVQLAVTDAAAGADLVKQVAAALFVTDLGAGVEAVLVFDSATRIVKITFKLKSRVISSVLSARTIDFSLSTRTINIRMEEFND